MADKNSRVRGQFQDFADGSIQRFRTSAGEVGASGAVVGHEQCITDKRSVAD